MSQPVLVIGAGPVGMTLASELARYGVAVRVIDKATARTDKSKALVVWSRTLELLDRGGPDGAAPFIAAGLKANAFNIVAGAKPIGRIVFDEVDSPYKFGLMLPQSETERLLEERLAGQGVTVERQVELTAFTRGADGVDAVLRHADGQEERAAAAWMAGCDGAHSVVRHGVGAEFPGVTMGNDWMLADIHLRGYPFPESENAIYWHADGVLIFFPISPGRFRIVADLRPSGAAHPPTPTLPEVQQLIDRRGPQGLEAYDPVWLSGFRINGRKVSDYRHGRVFLAGDAAHVHSPAGGQGMNTGMQDAMNLAWKLAMVVRGEAGEQLLDSYSAERSAVGDQVLKAADRMTDIGTLTNPVTRSLRDVAAHLVLGFHAVTRKAADAITEVSLGYPHSPLNGPSLRHGPQPGERVVPLAGQRPIGAGTTPRFALLAEPGATARLVQRFPALLDPTPRSPPASGGLWLVRPDGYVAMAADTEGSIADHLERIAAAGP